MMTQLTLSLNIFIFALVMLIAMFVGYLFGRRNIVEREKRIIELEREMLASHEEILNLTAEVASLKETLQQRTKNKTYNEGGAEESDPKIRKIG